MKKKIFHSYHFWNLEQLLCQAEQYYGAGNAEYDAAMTQNVNAVIDRLNLPLFNPDWKEQAERDALTFPEPPNLVQTIENLERFFTEYEKKSDCFRDRIASDYEKYGTDENTIYENYVRVLAGIRAIIPATA